MPNTILVTGATGTTGRRLVPLLVAHGASVRAASRHGDVAFDWQRPETHAAALGGASAIYLVPPSFVEAPAPIVTPFLAAARAAGVGHVVLLSSLGVTFPGEPPTSGRRALEDAVRASGLAWTILRPGFFAQNFSEGFLRPGVAQGRVAAATGDGRVGFLDAGDIARVAAAVLAAPGAHAGATYALTGPEARSLPDAIALIGRAARRAIAFQPISGGDLAALLGGFGVPADYAAMIVRDQQAIRDGAGAVVTDAVERVTGARPVDFGAFVAGATWS